MKALGFTDANEFKDYKSLSSDKTNNWSSEDNKTFVEAMKNNGLKFSDIKKAMSDPEVKKIMNGKLWDIKDSSGKWKISNEGAKEFKKLVEQKAAPKTTGEVKTDIKTDTKTENKDTKNEQKSDNKVSDSNNDAEVKEVVKNVFKSLSVEDQNKIKTSAKTYKDSKNQLKNFDETSQGYKATKVGMDDEAKKIKNLLSGDAQKYFNIEKHIGLFESKNNVSEIFTILEQNYFSK